MQSVLLLRAEATHQAQLAAVSAFFVRLPPWLPLAWVACVRREAVVRGYWT